MFNSIETIISNLAKYVTLCLHLFFCNVTINDKYQTKITILFDENHTIRKFKLLQTFNFVPRRSLYWSVVCWCSFMIIYFIKDFWGQKQNKGHKIETSIYLTREAQCLIFFFNTVTGKLWYHRVNIYVKTYLKRKQKIWFENLLCRNY